MPGPAIHTDIADIYVFRRHRQDGNGRIIEFLQLRRLRPPAAGTWQPVMGHIENDETAITAALRELREETTFHPGDGGRIIGFWQLECVNTFFIASLNRVMMCPCFACEVEPGAEPVIDAAHDAHRWVARDHVGNAFLWPGQRSAIDLIIRDLVPHDSPMRELLRIPL